MMLMTKAIANKLKAVDLNYVNGLTHGKESTRSPDEVIVKFFNPCGAHTWWIVQATPVDANGEPDYETDAPDDWHMFGFADIGDAQCAELGYVMLSQLEEIELPFGLTIERDLHYNGESLSDVQKRYARLAAGVPA